MPDFKKRFSSRTLLSPACRSALVLLGAALLASCGNGTPTSSDVLRGAIALSVEPNPVVANQSALNFGVTATYKIVVTETQGLGGDLVFVNATVFDPSTGQQLVLNYFDAADLIVYAGKKHLDPKGSLSFTQTASYTLADHSKAATLTLLAQFRDDNGNVSNASLLVKIE